MHGVAKFSVDFYRAYLSPIISILGIVGNILVIIIFCNEKRQSRFSIYCIFLAIIHIIILITNGLFDDFFGRGILYLSNQTIFYTKLDVKSKWSCKFMEYLPNAAYFASSCVVIIFTIDRLATIFKPLKYLSINYIRTSIIVVLIICLCSLLLHLPIVFIYTIMLDFKHGFSNSNLKCDIAQTYGPSTFLFNFTLYLKVIFAFVIPNFIVIVLNFIICFKLWLIQKTRASLLPTDSKSNKLEMSRVIGHLAVSSCFILLTMPLVIVMILRLYATNNNYKYHYPLYYDILKHLSRLFSSVKDINYAVDFLLYCAFLPNFRWRFIRYLCWICRNKQFYLNTKFGQNVENKVQKFDSDNNRRRYTVSYNTTKPSPHHININDKTSLSKSPGIQRKMNDY